MSSSSSSDQTMTVRYAPYLETHHQNFLNKIQAEVTATIDSSPFAAWSAIDINNAFFGTGYVIANFPSLYDMYGKFMAGLDVETLYNEIYTEAVESPAVDTLVAAEAALMDDDITTNVLPRFELGMRDMNSVMSSSYVIGKSVIEDARVKALDKFRGGLKYSMIPVATERWKAHLEWNKNVILSYAEIMKLYYSVVMDVSDLNYSIAAKNLLWPFTVLEYQRAAIGALQSATTTKTDVAGASTVAKVLGGALSMGAMGLTATAGNPIGGAIGGLIGLASGFFK